MRKAVGTIYILILLSLIGCKRMPLYDLEKVVELELELELKLDLKLDIDVKVDIEVDTVIPTPEYMKVNFYSVDNEGLNYTEFVGPQGGEINTPPGTYVMLIYNFGTEYIQIRGEGNLNTIEAFTSDITATKGATLRSFSPANRAGETAESDEPQGPVIYAPDHLLVTRETVIIPDLASESRTVTVYATVSDVVESYAFEVPHVQGAEYIQSVEAFVTNQSRSSFFGRPEVSKEPATIWFPVGVDREKGYLFTVFNTFGKLPGESRCFLHLLITNTEGQEIHVTTDITDQFVHPDPEHDHTIVIDQEIVVPPPGDGGGIDPSVDPWTEENTDVPIG